MIHQLVVATVLLSVFLHGEVASPAFAGQGAGPERLLQTWSGGGGRWGLARSGQTVANPLFSSLISGKPPSALFPDALAVGLDPNPAGAGLRYFVQLVAEGGQQLRAYQPLRSSQLHWPQWITTRCIRGYRCRPGRPAFSGR